MLARIAIYASLCVAGTHANISVHGRDDIQDIVTTDGLLAFSRNLSLAMMRRTGLAERDKYLAMLRRHGYPSAAEKEFGAAVTGYGNLRAGLWTALESEHFVAAHRQTEKDAPALWLEFGVFTGSSINATRVFADELAARGAAAPRVVGFDTFEGLPEAWAGHFAKGAFRWRGDRRSHGTLRPPTRSGVSFEVGLFNDTLGPFLARNGGPVAHANIDNDLYGGAKQALDDLAPRFFHGTRLHFHEIGDMKRGNVGAAAAASLATVQEECRALFDWLVARPCARLHLVEVAENPKHEAAVFVVHRLTCG